MASSGMLCHVALVLTRATWHNIPKDAILHSHHHGNLKPYRDVSPVKYKLGFYIPDNGTLHSHRCESLKSYNLAEVLVIFPNRYMQAQRSYHKSTYSCLFSHQHVVQYGIEVTAGICPCWVSHMHSGNTVYNRNCKYT
jgi:hypothetical protein